MPRFLDVWKGTFEWIEDPKSVPYAILSHTWRAAGEQTYQDICGLQESLRVAGPSDTIRPRTLFFHPCLSDKIKGIFKIVRESGCRLLWIDACCIDKSSSAELSEAINSMYAWYTLADVCYVYLEDVSDREDPGAPKGAFRRSRWHTRGWTLQEPEFIAPERVVFLTQRWHFLGTKMTLAPLLAEITGIDLDVITGRAPVHSSSVARRMSWAAQRCTTRIEDHAYSLLGIFGIHMSPIYGEGTNSFLRLQEEIVRTIPDQTIFAWGRQCHVSTWSEDLATGEGSISPGLFAESPSDFATVGDIAPPSPREFALRLGRDVQDVPPLRCTFTPEGVHVDLIRIDLTSGGRARILSQPCSACPPDPHQESIAPSLALLRCQDELGSLIALPLCRSTSEESNNQLGLSIRTHMQCPHCLDPSSVHIPSSHNMRLTEAAFKAVRECVVRGSVEALLFHQQPHRLLQKSHYGYWISHQYHPLLFMKAKRVRVSPDCTRALRTLGFAIHGPLRYESEHGDNHTVVISLMSHPREHSVSVDTIQFLEIRITLATAASDPQALAIKFSVVNYVHFSLEDLGMVSEDILRTPFGFAKKAPCPPGSVDSCSSLLGHFDLNHRRFELEMRILAAAHFDIYADADWTSITSYLKHLRVTLEYPPVLRPDVDKDEGLWVSVELTEQYRAESPRCAEPLHEPAPIPVGEIREKISVSFLNLPVKIKRHWRLMQVLITRKKLFWSYENLELPPIGSTDTPEGMAAMRLLYSHLASTRGYGPEHLKLFVNPDDDSDSKPDTLVELLAGRSAGPSQAPHYTSITVPTPAESTLVTSRDTDAMKHAEEPPETFSDNKLATVYPALTRLSYSESYHHDR
ncbi:Vegetative incompatibility protein HET-E-1 [Trametes pubescens]|uniref:Vegetative incompatibility protein HET-E-1 n=1 Tax=Trametes pubescens TaxID=154538 RepID=A0A1M2V7X5_TRAPU|nr:Vegetative incompatibility protein HET-E-1 [Trametes pubescens]